MCAVGFDFTGVEVERKGRQEKLFRTRHIRASSLVTLPGKAWAGMGRDRLGWDGIWDLEWCGDTGLGSLGRGSWALVVLDGGNGRYPVARNNSWGQHVRGKGLALPTASDAMREL